MFDVKNLKATMDGYISENVCVITNEDDLRNCFSIQAKAKKNTSKLVRTCKLSSGIRLRQDCRGARFSILFSGFLSELVLISDFPLYETLEQH